MLRVMLIHINPKPSRSIAINGVLEGCARRIFLMNLWIELHSSWIRLLHNVTDSSIHCH
ncbi:hypothetical protein YC2023_068993 [Brassica napus]